MACFSSDESFVSPDNLCKSDSNSDVDVWDACVTVMKRWVGVLEWGRGVVCCSGWPYDAIPWQ